MRGQGDRGDRRYGPFTNELLVGETLEPFRKDVVIATKYLFEIPPPSAASVGEPGLTENISPFRCGPPGPASSRG